MSYIGNTSTTQTYAAAIDYFSGNGSTTAFTLSKPVAATPQIQVVVNNVPQNPGTAFTVSGSTLTFTSAPSTGSNNIYVYYTSPVTQVIAPSAGTVQSSSIASGGPTWDASGNVSTYNGANISAGNTFGFKNRLINGAMMIDQRNAGASVSPTTGQVYELDRWNTYRNASGAFSVQQVSDGPTGFTKSAKITITSAYAGSLEQYNFAQFIEGNNISDLGFGGVSASNITLSFWVKSSVTGTFSAAITNYAGDASYPFTYTISSANTWEQKTKTISGATIGTWPTDTSASMRVIFDLGAQTSVEGTANTWSAGYYYRVAGSVRLIATNAATIQFTGVQLEKGSTATSFDFRDYGRELIMCQRYAVIHYGGTYGAINSLSSVFALSIALPVTMRAQPTFSTNISDSNFVVAAPSSTQWTLYQQNSGYSSYTGSINTISMNPTTSTQNWVQIGTYSITLGAATAFQLGSGRYFSFVAEL